MSMPLQLVWDLIALDNASGVFHKVGMAADKTAAQTSGMGKAFAVAGAAIAVAAVGVAVVSTKMAVDFQSSMLLIQTQAGASSTEVASMSKAILDLAGPVATAPEALALSLYHVESVGIRGAAALDVVKIAAEGAKVGQADLEQTTNALTAAVASGIPGVQNMQGAMGQLNTIVGAGDMKMQDLNEALGSGLLTVVKGFGLNLSDVGAALATFGDNNIRGADAATELRMAVQAMAKPVKGGEATLKALGITTGQLAKDMQEGGLNQALMDLRDHMDKAGVKSNEVGQVILDAFGKKAGVGIAVLEGQMPRFETKLKDITDAGNSFGADWEAWLTTVTAKWDGLKAQLEAIAIKIGTALLPVVAAAIDKLSHFTTEFENGTGAGGKFRDVLVAINNDGIKPLISFITGTAIPAGQSFVQWFKDNKLAVEVLGTVITTALLPVFADIAAAWVTGKIEAVTSAAVQFAAHYTVVAGWVTHGTTAVTSAALDAGAWISLRWEAATGAASEFASHTLAGEGWLGHAATALLSAPGIVESWITLKWEAITSAASEVASHAFGEAGWIAHAATAMASGIKMAAAWVIGLGPVAWIIAAVVAVAAAFVWAYNNVGWFKDGVDWMCKSVGIAFTSMWNYVLEPVLKFLLAGLANVLTTWGDFLVSLGKIPGGAFDWATDAGNKILGAAGAVRGLSSDLKKIPPIVDVAINVTANYSAAVATVLGGARAAIKLAGLPGAAYGGTFDPTPGGTAIRVAEAGRRETVVDTATLNAAMAQRNGPGTGTTQNVTNNIYETVSAEATAMQVTRRLNRLAAV